MLDELVQTLLYEGYALYPYTPGATKNSTPTPFGIVYPPQYAKRSPGTTFDRACVQCLVAEADADATLTATLWFLSPSGARHEAEPHCVEIEPVQLGGDIAVEDFPGGRLTLGSMQLEDGRWRVSVCALNTSEIDPGPARADALEHSLISTHIVLRIGRGQFLSPLDSHPQCKSINSFPVLATPEDDAILGAAIVLPDHPQLAPESRGNLFDNTEIEEALLLHVQVMTDAERAEIEDPGVRAMIDRALAATPQELLDLHGRLTEVSDRG
ncbi:MAG: hypothetical protein ACR2ND_13950 [Solirubrobacteraceae bacterium]